jgi:type IV secretory pathway ATPase VirB11/archaellum biosynthesis ATPase
MKAIAAYIDSKEKAFKLKPIAQEIIEKLETTIFNRQNELVLSVDEEGFESRRFRDSKPEDPRPERATEVASLMEQDIEEKEPFLFNRLKDNSIQNLFKEVVLDNPIGTLEERVDAFLASLRNYDQFKSDLKTIESLIDAQVVIRENIMIKKVKHNFLFLYLMYILYLKFAFS